MPQIKLTNYQQLQLLTWSRAYPDEIEEEDIAGLLRQYWRFIDEPTLTPKEREMIDYLRVRYW